MTSFNSFLAFSHPRRSPGMANVEPSVLSNYKQHANDPTVTLRERISAGPVQRDVVLSHLQALIDH